MQASIINNKYFAVTLKNTAKSMARNLANKEKIEEKIKNLQAALETEQAMIDAFNAPIKVATGGYGVEDLVIKIEKTYTDKNGREVNTVTYELKYPDTVIPPTEAPTLEPTVTPEPTVEPVTPTPYWEDYTPTPVA